jgi:hypothetical protein
MASQIFLRISADRAKTFNKKYACALHLFLKFVGTAIKISICWFSGLLIIDFRRSERLDLVNI